MLVGHNRPYERQRDHKREEQQGGNASGSGFDIFPVHRRRMRLNARNVNQPISIATFQPSLFSSDFSLSPGFMRSKRSEASSSSIASSGNFFDCSRARSRTFCASLRDWATAFASSMDGSLPLHPTNVNRRAV